MTKSYDQRKFIIGGIFILIGLVFSIKLFFLQVMDSEYKLSAENNVLRYITQYPARGMIFDRNGELLVFNEAAYDLMVVPRQISAFDTTELCTLLHITKEDLESRLDKAKRYSSYKPSVILEQVSRETFAFLAEKLFKYPGFYVQARSLRRYTYPSAAHVLGHVGEVSKREIEHNRYYQQGDYIGKNGVEKAYERELRGSKGMKIILVDVFNREKGSFQGGRYDTAAVPGKNIHITIDSELQQYGERLLKNKVGSIVALDPKSGEILSLVSSPAFNPNLLVGRIRSDNYRKLSVDTLKPIFNRATMARYPPGSTFKTVLSLICLQDEVIHPYTAYSCQGLASYPIPCSHDHESPLDFVHAIEQSCNPYFYKVFKAFLEQDHYGNIQEAYEDWREKVMAFGIAQSLETDLLEQSKGFLPPYSYFDKYYGKKGWKAITVRSLSIGQGEIELTPLQMANAGAIMANRGYYYPPHLVKNIEGIPDAAERFKVKKEVPVDKEHFEKVIDGMQLVYEGEMGSARWYRYDTVTALCGKTGTSQNPHGDNHSVFIAFAPRENPEIAIAVVVENSGYGSTWAAPIATLMIEKYLTGKVKPKWWENKMLNADLIHKE
jgi:penicillin-binding protein 2